MSDFLAPAPYQAVAALLIKLLAGIIGRHMLLGNDDQIDIATHQVLQWLLVMRVQMKLHVRRLRGKRACSSCFLICQCESALTDAQYISLQLQHKKRAVRLANG
ncbi:hypothetical protein TMS3_0107405 [Pseudomonas taeanensis MS-3]|uniref:Uncharacterized protein n=1 Tax=Pseudomonas taeanensis MS-3 TaxID=1395571 RepID=A0A0A1YQW1_9PSED|nr:hypothetical protein TMS3_0107405 [Pseudomonas taeanensis MS-3]